MLVGAGVGTSEKKNALPHVFSGQESIGAIMGASSVYRKGRDKGNRGALSQVKVEMQKSEAFRSLSASAMRVLIYAIFLNYFAASHTTGRPVFKFTNKTAKDILGMNQQTFTRAKKDLADKGFWEWVKRGGLKGCNGIASEFSLSSDWKTWSSKETSSHTGVTGGSHTEVTGLHK